MRKWISHHLYLLRLILLAILISFIPALLMLFYSVRTTHNNLNQSVTNSMEEVAESTLSQFESYLGRMQRITYKIGVDQNLRTRYLTAAVQYEMYGIETLNHYLLSLPFAEDIGLYNIGSDNVYLASGKYKSYIYAQYVLNIDFDVFVSIQSGTNQTEFAPVNLIGPNKMLLLTPIRTSISDKISRINYFYLSRETLVDSFNTILNDDYSIAAIYNQAGMLIYLDKDNPLFNSYVMKAEAISNIEEITEISVDETDYMMIPVQSNAYRMMLTIEKSSLLSDTRNFTRSYQTLIVLCIVICTILVFLMVEIAYSPVNKIVKKLNDLEFQSMNPQLGEFDQIYDILNTQLLHRHEAQRELDFHKQLITIKLYENLLNGIPINDKERTFLNINIAEFFVACTALNNFQDVNNISHLFDNTDDLKALEMYEDGYMVFICGVPSKDRKARMIQARRIQQITRVPHLHMGIGNIYNQLEELRISYQEASVACERVSDSDLVCYDDVSLADTSDSGKILSSESLNNMIKLLKFSNLSELAAVSEMFNAIQRYSPSLSIQNYYCYLMINHFRKTLERLGINHDDGYYAQLVQPNSLAATRTIFLAELEKAREEIYHHNKSVSEKISEDIMSFIVENYTDPSFGLDTIATHFNITDSTASRMVRTHLGISFTKYVLTKRLQRAKTLLNDTDLSIKDIARMCGFTSASYFIRVFKSAEGITPISFRSKSN